MTSHLADQHGLVEQYLLGGLEGPDLEAFEQHLLECGRCLETLQTMHALRDELSRQRTAILREPSDARFGPRSKLAAVAAAVVVAAGLGVWQMRTQRPSPSAARAVPPAAPAIAEAPRVPPTTVPEAAGARRADRPAGTHDGSAQARRDLMALARVEPPQYIPFRVRGAGDAASAEFDRAMRDYADADYHGAARRLQAVETTHPNDAATNFFLGVSLMMIDDVGAAVDALRRTIQLGDSPFRQVASLDLAKALIRQGDLEGARQELNRTRTYRGSHAAEARRLRRQLQEIVGVR